MHSVPILSLILAANAAVLPLLSPRALPPGCEEAYEEIALVEFNDGPTVSGEAGIGAEFETLRIQFGNSQCSLEDTFKAKRKTIKGRSGKNFVLSADTSVEQGKGVLSAEYVLDGRAIKVGDGSAGDAGKAARESLESWKPWDEDPANRVTLENYDDVSDECKKPWRVLNLKESTDKDSIWWAPQVTAPLPLEALYSLMKENVRDVEDNRNILNGDVGVTRGQNLYLVNKEYFQALGLIMDIDKVNDAVFGFCTLVLGYAKAASKPINDRDPAVIERSPKSWLPFMPRTDVPPSGELYEIFNTLACYKTDKDLKVSLDSDYCKGTVEKPEPGDKFGKLEYKYIGEYPNDDAIQSSKIKEWIEKIDSGEARPDLLTNLDKNYDGSIGGLNTATEKMFENTDRTVPLFEFRDLFPINTSEFENFMKQVDSSIQKLHKEFKDRPIIRVKREGVTECDIPSPTPNNPPPPAPSHASNQTSRSSTPL